MYEYKWIKYSWSEFSFAAVIGFLLLSVIGLLLLSLLLPVLLLPKQLLIFIARSKFFRTTLSWSAVERCSSFNLSFFLTMMKCSKRTQNKKATTTTLALPAMTRTEITMLRDSTINIRGSANVAYIYVYVQLVLTGTAEKLNEEENVWKREKKICSGQKEFLVYILKCKE